VLDRSFIDNQTAGFAEFRAALKAERWEEIMKQHPRADSPSGWNHDQLRAHNHLLVDGSDAEERGQRH